MKTIVIYKSETGFTKKYAEWIAEELNADIYDVSKVKADILNVYDTVIFGGFLHASGISGIKFIKQNFDKLKEKKIVIFATGASPSRKGVIDDVVNANFTPEEMKSLRFFYLRGGFDYSSLGLFDKFLMTLLKIKMKGKKKEELTGDEKGMLAVYDKPVDFTKKENIKELIGYVRS